METESDTHLATKSVNFPPQASLYRFRLGQTRASTHAAY